MSSKLGYLSRDQVPPNARTLCVVDVETTGLNPDTNEAIEIGLVLAAYDPSTCQILGILCEYSGLREPRCRISSKAREIHGISRDMVRGKEFDHKQVLTLLNQASFLVAHNADFDRAFVGNLYPLARHKEWRCTLEGIGWQQLGFRRRALDYICDELGFGNQGAHRALDDARRILRLLTSNSPIPNRTYLALLLEGHGKRVAAVGGHGGAGIGCLVPIVVALLIWLIGMS